MGLSRMVLRSPRVNMMARMNMNPSKPLRCQQQCPIATLMTKEAGGRRVCLLDTDTSNPICQFRANVVFRFTHMARGILRSGLIASSDMAGSIPVAE